MFAALEDLEVFFFRFLDPLERNVFVAWSVFYRDLRPWLKHPKLEWRNNIFGNGFERHGTRRIDLQLDA